MLADGIRRAQGAKEELGDPLRMLGEQVTVGPEAEIAERVKLHASRGHPKEQSRLRNGIVEGISPFCRVLAEDPGNHVDRVRHALGVPYRGKLRSARALA